LVFDKVINGQAVMHRLQ